MPVGNKHAGSRGSLNPAFDRRIKIHVGEIPIVIDSGKMAVYNGAGCLNYEKVPWWVVDDMFGYLMDEERKKEHGTSNGVFLIRNNEMIPFDDAVRIDFAT